MVRGSAGPELRRLVGKSEEKTDRGRRTSTWLEFGFDREGELKINIKSMMEKSEDKEGWKKLRKEGLGL